MGKVRVGYHELVAHPPCDEVSKSYRVRYRTCHIWTASNIDYRIVVQYWLKQKRVLKTKDVDNWRRLRRD
jgi:hypothetical protein